MKKTKKTKKTKEAKEQEKLNGLIAVYYELKSQEIDSDGKESLEEDWAECHGRATNLVPRACVTLIQRMGNRHILGADQKDRSLWERD